MCFYRYLLATISRHLSRRSSSDCRCIAPTSRVTYLAMAWMSGGGSGGSGACTGNGAGGGAFLWGALGVYLALGASGGFFGRPRAFGAGSGSGSCTTTCLLGFAAFAGSGSGSCSTTRCTLALEPPLGLKPPGKQPLRGALALDLAADIPPRPRPEVPPPSFD